MSERSALLCCVRMLMRAIGWRKPATSILLIRTGGEKRLSDFLLWESAYAELFLPTACGPISMRPRPGRGA